MVIAVLFNVERDVGVTRDIHCALGKVRGGIVAVVEIDKYAVDAYGRTAAATRFVRQVLAIHFEGQNHTVDLAVAVAAHAYNFVLYAGEQLYNLHGRVVVRQRVAGAVVQNIAAKQ